MYSPFAARPRGRKRCGGAHVAAFLILCFMTVPGRADVNVSGLDPEAIRTPITLDGALQRFRERGFDLLIADAAVDAAEADVRVPAPVPNPSVAVSRSRSATYDPTRWY